MGLLAAAISLEPAVGLVRDGALDQPCREGGVEVVLAKILPVIQTETAHELRGGLLSISEYEKKSCDLGGDLGGDLRGDLVGT